MTRRKAQLERAADMEATNRLYDFLSPPDTIQTKTTEEIYLMSFKIAEQPSPIVDEFLRDAQSLEAEKTDLMARINANREILRNLRTSGKANQAQADAIAAFYKDRAKNGKGEDTPAEDAKAAPAKSSK